MASDEISTLDRASLERFQSELLKAGFSPVPESPYEWLGPIPDALREFTKEARVKIAFQDGWPYTFPKLFAKGIAGEHVNAEGEVCLWRPGDGSLQWTSYVGFLERITEWCLKTKKGFEQGDLVLDAHLYYANKNKQRALALLDATLFKPKDFVDGDYGDLSWSKKKPPTVVVDMEGGVDKLGGRWYFRSQIKVPPKDLEGIRGVLLTNQRTNFDRWIKGIRTGGHNACGLLVLLWNTPNGRNILIVKVSNIDGALVDEAYEASPTDTHTLMLRAGDHVETFSKSKLILFGAGAIGSHLALALAEMGLGRLVICEAERLRPGNAVRHIAGKSFFGELKVEAVDFIIKQHAPWTATETVKENTWNPERLAALIAPMDLVIDATGLASFTDQLSRLTEQAGKHLVSVALFRGGAIGRVRRQVATKDFPIYRRIEKIETYPVIPPGGAEEIVGMEAGCSSPVINASPILVQSVSALAARVIIDLMSKEFMFGEDIIEVYSPIGVEPFDSIGMVSFRAEPSAK